jgi:hypothetical protein
MSNIFGYSTLGNNKNGNFLFTRKQNQCLLLQWTMTPTTYIYTGLTNLISISIQTPTHMTIV